MTELKKEKCIPISKGTLPIPEAEIGELKPQIPEWQILIYDGMLRLERVFRFRNFAEALAFTVKVGELAERDNHHPAILTEWGRVTITWWTHAIGGLHRNDFIMAVKTNALFDAGSSGTVNSSRQWYEISSTSAWASGRPIDLDAVWVENLPVEIAGQSLANHQLVDFGDRVR